MATLPRVRAELWLSKTQSDLAGERIGSRASQRRAGPTSLPAWEWPTASDLVPPSLSFTHASAIIVPSHSISLKVNDDVKKRLEGTLLSPMGDL